MMGAFTFTLAGMLVAGLIYSLIYPLSMTQIRYAITIGAFASLLIFFFGNAEGTRLNRFFGSLLAGSVLLVSGLLILGVFEPLFAGIIIASVFAFAFALLKRNPAFFGHFGTSRPRPQTRHIGFTAVSAGGSGPTGSRGIQDLFAGMFAGLDLNANPLDVLRAYLTADTRLETATLEAQTAQHLLAIQAAMHATLRLAGETNAVDEANKAAGAAGLHPNVYHMLEFQLEKLRSDILEQSKVKDIELEELRRMVDVKIAWISEEVKRMIREQREQERNKNRPSQTNNGENAREDIPRAERTTGRRKSV